MFLADIPNHETVTEGGNDYQDNYITLDSNEADDNIDSNEADDNCDGRLFACPQKGEAEGKVNFFMGIDFLRQSNQSMYFETRVHNH
jgi:hypothetical protein